MVVGTLVWGLAAVAQESAGPLSQNQLFDALKAGGLPADELSAIIRRRGLDFEMSVGLEQRFRESGADSGVVLALWEKERWTPPQGAPLAKDFLVGLLQSGTAPQRMTKWIAVRKINFELTPAVAKELQSAGAPDLLLGMMATNNVWLPPAAPVVTQAKNISRLTASLNNDSGVIGVPDTGVMLLLKHMGFAAISADLYVVSGESSSSDAIHPGPSDRKAEDRYVAMFKSSLKACNGGHSTAGGYDFWCFHLDNSAIDRRTHQQVRVLGRVTSRGRSFDVVLHDLNFYVPVVIEVEVRDAN